jgi:hypothetical protein
MANRLEPRKELMTTATEMRNQILSRADEDSDFRARLIADPNAAIADEIGMSLPHGFEVTVHEDSATTTHLVLPPSPALTDAELEMATGANLWNRTFGTNHPG